MYRNLLVVVFFLIRNVRVCFVWYRFCEHFVAFPFSLTFSLFKQNNNYNTHKNQLCADVCMVPVIHNLIHANPKNNRRRIEMYKSVVRTNGMSVTKRMFEYTMNVRYTMYSEKQCQWILFYVCGTDANCQLSIVAVASIERETKRFIKLQSVCERDQYCFTDKLKVKRRRPIECDS